MMAEHEPCWWKRGYPDSAWEFLLDDLESAELVLRSICRKLRSIGSEEGEFGEARDSVSFAVARVLRVVARRNYLRDRAKGER